MQKKFPEAAGYFDRFKSELSNRSGYKKYLKSVGEPYYAIYNVGPYTFAPYKVVWRYIAEFLTCAVIGSVHDKLLGNKILVPDTKLMLIPFENESEAHFVCSCLNSAFSRFVVKSYVVETQIAPHILENINIPKFDPKTETHKELARLSKQCHEKVASGISVSDLQEQIDELTAELWGLSKVELKDIKESLEEMR